MSAGEKSGQRGGLSLQTLLLASVSSAIAALIVSRFWRGGTVVTAALMPVLVALVSEALRRPTERISDVARPLAAARPRPRARPERAREAPRFGEQGPPPRLRAGRRVRIQIALLTAALAFVIAAAALTLPELLLFDRSVGGTPQRTTLFGGKATPRREEQRPASEREQTSTAPTDSAPDTRPATPSTTSPAPAQPATPTTTPTEPAPGGGQPAPPQTAPAPGATTPPQ